MKVSGEGGGWRSAGLISHGTSEQVYLLLRVAMAKHLTRGSEVSPLILDDVFVQSDSGRTVAFLDLLHELSSERQVILFSQEQEALSWARERLHEPTDRLVELSPASIDV